MQVGGLGGFGVLGWVGTETNIYKESTKESTLHVGGGGGGDGFDWPTFFASRLANMVRVQVQGMFFFLPSSFKASN